MSDIQLATLDPRDPAHLADPYPAWQQAQDGGRPVYLRALRAWAVTSHDQVLAVVRDPATYSSAPSGSSERDLASLRSAVPHACPEDFHALANSDPPTHTRIRRASQKMLTPKSVSVYEPYVRSVCAGLIEGFAADGRADIVQRLAVPLPLTVICHVLGIDPGSQQRLKQWSDDTVRLHMPGLSADERVGLARSSAELHDFLAAADRRPASRPATGRPCQHARAARRRERADLDGRRGDRGPDPVADRRARDIDRAYQQHGVVARARPRFGRPVAHGACARAGHGRGDFALLLAGQGHDSHDDQGSGTRRPAYPGWRAASRAVRRGQPGSGPVLLSGKLRPGPYRHRRTCRLRPRYPRVHRRPAGATGGAGGARADRVPVAGTAAPARREAYLSAKLHGLQHRRTRAGMG